MEQILCDNTLYIPVKCGSLKEMKQSKNMLVTNIYTEIKRRVRTQLGVQLFITW